MKREIDYSKYCVIIPAYNAEKQIDNVIGEIKNVNQNLTIIVVDDGSSDDTAFVVEKQRAVKLIRHEKNRGKGAAIKSGIQTALINDFHYALFIDADLQHDPQKVNDFIDIREKDDLELVLGLRTFWGSGMPFHRILSNSITSFMISLRIGKRVHDSQCGYRLIDITRIKTDDIINDGFQFESEFLIKMIYSGMKYSEILIPTTYNKSGSSINNVMDTVRFTYLYLKSFFWF